MIPLKDENPTERKAIIVPILIAINIVVFLFIQPTLSGGSSASRAEQGAEFAVCKASIPYEVTHRTRLADADPSALNDTGQLFGRFQRERCPHKSVWLSILTSMFLHGGFLHIAGNMLFLFVFGNNIEDRLGRFRFTIFYLLCGLAATLGQSYVGANSATPLIGASGAIAGVLGAYLVLFPRARVKTLIIFFFITVMDLPAVLVLGLWFVLQIFQGVGSVSGAPGGVAYVAHIAGFIAGMALLLVFRPRRVSPSL